MMTNIDNLHPAEILRIALEKCEALRDHCKTIPEYSAIAEEWNRAAVYVTKAIEEVDY